MWRGVILRENYSHEGVRYKDEKLYMSFTNLQMLPSNFMRKSMFG